MVTSWAGAHRLCLAKTDSRFLSRYVVKHTSIRVRTNAS